MEKRVPAGTSCWLPAKAVSLTGSVFLNCQLISACPGWLTDTW